MEVFVEPMLQWHPAFFAGIRIEFSEEENKVQFESEHQLGTKPIQLIVTSRLSKEQNFWLKNLTDDLANREAV